MIQVLACVLAVYSLISLFFFIFPGLIHRKNRKLHPIFLQALNSKRILTMGHRGCPRYVTENTMEGFIKAGELADCLEMDVCETADQVLVVHHDRDLHRTCGVDGDVDEYNFQDLPEFKDKITLDFAVSTTVSSKGEKIPKLEQVFKKFPNMIMNIQLKTPTDSAMKQFVGLLKEYNRVDKTIVGIRNHRNMQLQAENPELLVFMNDKKVHTLAVCYFLGLAPFLPINESSLQIPVYSTEFQEWHVSRTPAPEKWRARFFMRIVKLLNFVTRPLIWHLRRRQVMSFGWVCNTDEAYQNGLSGGFQGVMSDDILKLHTYIQSRGSTSQQ